MIDHSRAVMRLMKTLDKNNDDKLDPSEVRAGQMNAGNAFHSQRSAALSFFRGMWSSALDAGSEAFCGSYPKDTGPNAEVIKKRRPQLTLNDGYVVLPCRCWPS